MDDPHSLDRLTSRTFAAVLFDLDGTLVDSTESVRRSWLRWAGDHGVDPARLPGRHGVPARQIIESLLPSDQVDRALLRIEEMEVADAEGIMVLPGAHDALAALPTGRAAIVTSCTRPLAGARIEATGLRPPAVVVTASDVAVGKPDPAPYLLAARWLGVDPADCLVVEDAPAGLESAKRAGCARLAVVTTTPLADLDADAAVANLAGVHFDARESGVQVRPLLVGGPR